MKKNYSEQELIEILKNKYKSVIDNDNPTDERVIHSIGVYEMALKLNQLHKLNVSEEKIKITALLHDYSKYDGVDSIKQILKENNMEFDETISPKLWHSLYGPLFIKRDLGIDDEEILNAIYYHSTGRANMTNLEKLIYLSDYTETKTRSGDIFEKCRKASFISLDKGVAVEAEYTYNRLKEKGIEPKGDTLDAYNYYKKYLD